MEISKTYGKNEWLDDLRNVLSKAGFGERHSVFLFTDTQVTDLAESRQTVPGRTSFRLFICYQEQSGCILVFILMYAIIDLCWEG